MRLTTFQILAFTFFFSCSLARDLRFKQNSNVIPNPSVDPVEMTKRDDRKYVFMHIVSSVQLISRILYI